MICFPNAKINLGLNVVGVRPDGYHNIETVFCPIPLRDALEAIPLRQGTDHFSSSGIVVDGPLENNLVMKALKLLRSRYSFPSLDIYLHKSIPFGAGLGGGSADAAFFLKLVNDLCRLQIDDGTLRQLAGELGADCPFFISNKPVFAKGTGNVFEDIPFVLEEMFFYLVKPDIAVSTREAYAGIQLKEPEVSLKEIIRKPVGQWCTAMRNDFEESVFLKHPAIGQIKQSLYDLGATYASMSGSGSSVFGLFKNKPQIPDTLFHGCYTFIHKLAISQ